MNRQKIERMIARAHHAHAIGSTAYAGQIAEQITRADCLEIMRGRPAWCDPETRRLLARYIADAAENSGDLNIYF